MEHICEFTVMQLIARLQTQNTEWCLSSRLPFTQSILRCQRVNTMKKVMVHGDLQTVKRLRKSSQILKCDFILFTSLFHWEIFSRNRDPYNLHDSVLEKQLESHTHATYVKTYSDRNGKKKKSYCVLSVKAFLNPVLRHLKTVHIFAPAHLLAHLYQAFLIVSEGAKMQ